MKIKVNRKHHHGKKLVIPFLGEIEVPEDGVINVKDEKQAKFLVEKGPKSFSYADGETAEKSAATDKKEKKAKEKEEVKDELSDLKLKDLIAIAKESELNGWQPIAKKPEKLRAWLRKKLKAATEGK